MVMYVIVYSLILIIAGVLAIPALILSKRPSAKDILDKVAPYQGWFGIAILILGLWNVVDLLIDANFYFAFGLGGSWVLLFVSSAVMAILGFILGFNLINVHLLSKNPKSEENGQKLMTKLMPLQNIFGIAAIVLGIILLLIFLL